SIQMCGPVLALLTERLGETTGPTHFRHSLHALPSPDCSSNPRSQTSMTMRVTGWIAPGYFFFSSRRRHTRCLSDWSSDVCYSDLDVDLAVAHLGGVERREPHDELSVLGTRRLVADVGREDTSVGEEPAPVVLSVVVAGLVRRSELADLLGRELADRVALQLEDPPALGRVGLAGVLARDAALRSVGEEADLRVDVEPLRVVVVVAD